MSRVKDAIGPFPWGIDKDMTYLPTSQYLSITARLQRLEAVALMVIEEEHYCVGGEGPSCQLAWQAEEALK